MLFLMFVAAVFGVIVLLILQDTSPVGGASDSGKSSAAGATSRF
jgi:preprotein translocase subunit SecG